jgi:hypothetical protein
MLDMTDKSRDAGASPPRKTTFPDGRMATKEAWNFCQGLCKEREIRAPTLRTFKWHLKHGNSIKADLVPNPFGGAGPDKVYSISPEAVEAFVQELQTKGDGMHAVGDGVRVSVKPPEPSAAPVPSKPSSSDKELSSRAAFEYMVRKIGRKCELNSTTFGFYLAYDLIPSRWDKKQRFVRQDDLDAFLELAPGGVYANHLDYDVAMSRSPGDLSLKDAYLYYKDVDPTPITLNSFRSLVASGLIPAIRTANDPKAPVVGFKKRDIDAFLATRQRIMEKNREAPATKGFLTRKEREQKEPGVRSEVRHLIDDALAKAMPHLGPPPPRVKTDPPITVTPPPPPKVEVPKAVAPPVAKPRWVVTKKAYAYYVERTKKPFTDSWFRDKVYRGDLFRTKTEKDERSNNPSGKKYLVDLNSVDEYLAQDPKTKPKPQKAWPIEKAYHKFRELIPPGLSLLQFKRLVNKGLIRSFTKSSVVHVKVDAVETYFEGQVEGDKTQPLGMGAAYDYYCSRCTDPVAKAHFSRWVTQGEIEGGEQDEDGGPWLITMESIDSFLELYPSGRMRTNRNSRVARDEPPSSPKKKGSRAGRKLAQVVEEVREAVAPMPAPATGSAGLISISMSNYATPAEMKKALDLLTSQGFQVDVKP